MMNRLQIGSSESVTFRSKPGPKWVLGGSWVFSGLTLVVQSLVIMDGGRLYGIEEVPSDFTLPFGLICLVFASPLLVRGALVWLREWRGTNGLTVTANGIRLVSLGAKWAEWSSLTDFVLSREPLPRGVERVTAKAGIVGSAVSRSLRGQSAFVIPDVFPEPIATIVDELNALRPQSPANIAAAAIPLAAVPPRVSPFKMPKWLIVLTVLGLISQLFTGIRVSGTVLGTAVLILVIQPFLREQSTSKPQ